MSLPSSALKWLRLPGRIALLLGLGALSAAAGAKADIPEMGNEPARVPQQSAKSFGELQVWNDDGRICVSEDGEQARELPLGNTPEARRLRELLERNGAVADAPHVLQHRMILVGGGGKGISGGHWQRPEKPDAAAEAGKAGGPAKAARAVNRTQGSPASKTTDEQK